MNETDQTVSTSLKSYKGLVVVFVSSAVTVFGLLYQQMWTHSGGFDPYAFEYWAPRATGVVIGTTILGIAVARTSWKTRVGFGAVVGIALAFLYIWITN